jgi:hypothetical protein
MTWRALVDEAIAEIKHNEFLELLRPGQNGNCFGMLPRTLVGTPTPHPTIARAKRQRPELMALPGVEAFYREVTAYRECGSLSHRAMSSARLLTKSLRYRATTYWCRDRGVSSISLAICFSLRPERR